MSHLHREENVELKKMDDAARVVRTLGRLSGLIAGYTWVSIQYGGTPDFWLWFSVVATVGAVADSLCHYLDRH